MWKELKEFAMRGNVLDMAVGIIIGASFGKIVSSLVADILMPPIGLLIGKLDFTNFFISLSGQSFASLTAAKAAGAPVISYGIFINTVIDFAIVAFTVFLIVKQINRLKRPVTITPTTRDCPYCFSVIPLKATRCPHCTSQV